MDRDIDPNSLIHPLMMIPEPHERADATPVVGVGGPLSEAREAVAIRSGVASPGNPAGGGNGAATPGGGDVIDREDYLQTQAQLELLAGIIHGLDLDPFIEAAERALEIGPFADPTLWMRGHKKLEKVIRLARVLRAVKAEVTRQLAEKASG